MMSTDNVVPIKQIKCHLCKKNKRQVDKLVQADTNCYICNNCIDMCYELVHEHDVIKTLGLSEDINPKKLKATLDEYVVGQDTAKRVLSVAVYNHFKRLRQVVTDDTIIEKSNVLMIGASGTGKTFLIQTIANALGIPFVIADATSMTESGYVGLDVEDCLARLYQASDNDIERAQRGIIYIDEIDKKCKKGAGVSISRDVSGEGVQQALLKLIEGAEVKVPVGSTRKIPNGEFVTLNTKDILFIVGGAFVGIKDVVNERKNTKPGIGFNSKEVQKDEIVLHDLIAEDVVNYGMIPEFVGRLPIIAVLNELTENDLVHILTEPKNSLVKQFKKLFIMDGIKLEFTHQALIDIAKEAMAKKTGARGLRSIIEEILLPIQYELKDYVDNGVLKIIIDDNTVKTRGNPILISTEEQVSN